jgi:hypothetical protein
MSSLGTQQRKVLLAGLIAFFLLLGLMTLLLAYYVFEPEITSFLQKPTSIFNPTSISQSMLPTQMIIPTQTPSCSGASLQLGTTNWRIESIQRAADGSINVPSDTPGVAYWIENLDNNYVFALSPTTDNLNLLSALQSGEEAILTRENCNSETYYLSAPQAGEPGTEILTGEPAYQLVVYIPDSASASGVTVQGELVGETITSPPTYAPAPSEVNAEISLLETSTSPDGANLQVVISILNYGAKTITLTESDISLTPEGAAPLAISRADPILPQEIEPAESKTFTLDFPRPDTTTATLKIYTVVYDLDNY